ncbi:MAG: hypothetical protein EOO18_03180 [Chryseobacterium sp.]|nr:MAG: hypothetical protein EOO18_03180 [Chryseobacterium sp.]
MIISGAPGVGKTTLAFMLICERLAEGYDLVYCEGRIAEVEHLLSDDPKKKQIFFIDDFLGANLYDLRNPKNPENKLISFIHKFQSAKNKYLMLTSRTTILNQAHYDYEHLKNSGLVTLSQYELKLQQYSPLAKAKILYKSREQEMYYFPNNKYELNIEQADNLMFDFKNELGNLVIVEIYYNKDNNPQTLRFQYKNSKWILL